jgi:sigma-B regulation protein RsbU (phosphoserine phosphatase)
MLGNLQRSTDIRYYPIRTDRDEFVGIFNSQDLLYFLSELTQNDISLARSIQTRIVKESMQEKSSTIEIISSSTMAKGVGGDFYHYRQYNDSRWLFCLCDVSGKGVAASMVTCALWGAVSGFDMRYGISRLIRHLNNLMLQTFEQEKFATGVFIDYNATTKEMIIADAGHGYAYICRNGKLMRIKPAKNSWPLGISADMNIELYRYTLQKDDIVLLATDGLVEQPGKEETRYTMAPVQRLLETHFSNGLDQLRQRLLEDFHSFRGTNPLCDDLTFLMFRPC